MKKIYLAMTTAVVFAASPLSAEGTQDTAPVMTPDMVGEMTETLSTQSEDRGTMIVQMIGITFVILTIGSVN